MMTITQLDARVGELRREAAGIVDQLSTVAAERVDALEAAKDASFEAAARLEAKAYRLAGRTRELQAQLRATESRLADLEVELKQRLAARMTHGG